MNEQMSKQNSMQKREFEYDVDRTSAILNSDFGENGLKNFHFQEQLFAEQGNHSRCGIVVHKTKEMNGVFVFKHTRGWLWDLEHEFIVGRRLNELQSSFVRKTYALFRCQNGDRILILEYIKSECNLEELFFTIQRKVEDDIKDVDGNAQQLRRVVGLIFSFLLMAQNRIKFVHSDLHFGNILIVKSPTVQNDGQFQFEIGNENEKTRWSLSKANLCPVIIDFGFSFVDSIDQNPFFGSLDFSNSGYIPFMFDPWTDMRCLTHRICFQDKSRKLFPFFHKLKRCLFDPLDVFDEATGWVKWTHHPTIEQQAVRVPVEMLLSIRNSLESENDHATNSISEITTVENDHKTTDIKNQPSKTHSSRTPNSTSHSSHSSSFSDFCSMTSSGSSGSSSEMCSSSSSSQSECSFLSSSSRSSHSLHSSTASSHLISSDHHSAAESVLTTGPQQSKATHQTRGHSLSKSSEVASQKRQQKTDSCLDHVRPKIREERKRKLIEDEEDGHDKSVIFERLKQNIQQNRQIKMKRELKKQKKMIAKSKFVRDVFYEVLVASSVLSRHTFDFHDQHSETNSWVDVFETTSSTDPIKFKNFVSSSVDFVIHMDSLIKQMQFEEIMNVIMTITTKILEDRISERTDKTAFRDVIEDYIRSKEPTFSFRSFDIFPLVDSLQRLADFSANVTLSHLKNYKKKYVVDTWPTVKCIQHFQQMFPNVNGAFFTDVPLYDSRFHSRNIHFFGSPLNDTSGRGLSFSTAAPQSGQTMKVVDTSVSVRSISNSNSSSHSSVTTQSPGEHSVKSSDRAAPAAFVPDPKGCSQQQSEFSHPDDSLQFNPSPNSESCFTNLLATPDTAKEEFNQYRFAQTTLLSIIRMYFWDCRF